MRMMTKKMKIDRRRVKAIWLSFFAIRLSNAHRGFVLAQKPGGAFDGQRGIE